MARVAVSATIGIKLGDSGYSISHQTVSSADANHVYVSWDNTTVTTLDQLTQAVRACLLEAASQLKK